MIPWDSLELIATKRSGFRDCLLKAAPHSSMAGPSMQTLNTEREVASTPEDGNSCHRHLAGMPTVTTGPRKCKQSQGSLDRQASQASTVCRQMYMEGTSTGGHVGGWLHRAACRDRGRGLPVTGNLSHSLSHLVNQG